MSDSTNNQISDENDAILTDAEREKMHADIAQIGLTLGELDVIDAAHQPEKSPSSPAERLFLLDSLRAEIAASFSQIQSHPSVKNVTRTRRATPPETAKRVTPKALRDAIQRGHSSRFLEETRQKPSNDTPENRAVKAFLTALEREAATLEKQAKNAGKEDWMTLAQTLQKEFARHKRASFLTEVADEPGAEKKPPTQFARTAPGYRQMGNAIKLWRGGWTFGENWKLPAREDWRIYELWAFLQTANAWRLWTIAPKPSRRYEKTHFCSG